MPNYISNAVHGSYGQYPNLRGVLAPQYAGLPAEEIEALMESMFGPDAAEHWEDELEGIGDFFKKIAKPIANIGGGVVKGALAGSALGLPGIIAGGLAGGVGTGLSTYAKGPARNVGNVLGTVTNVAGQFSPMGKLGSTLGSAVSGLAGSNKRAAAGTALSALGGVLGKGGAGTAVSALGGLLGGGRSQGGGAGAALGALGSLFGGNSGSSQLLSLLRRPETMQALSALRLGPAGRSTIPVGSAQTPIPVAGIANLIGQLANQAAAEAAALSEGTEAPLRYMVDESGEYIGDPASEQDRAAILWDVLNEAQAERVLGEIVERSEEMNEARGYCPHCDSYHEDTYEDAEAEDYDEVYAEDYDESDDEDFDEDYDEDEDSVEALLEDYGDWDEDILDEDVRYEYA